jgi:hypothetical protein
MLDIFTEQIDNSKLHSKYKVIRDCLKLTGEQEILKDWIDGFIDRDNKIVKEFQESFHSTFWEFYLFAVFKEAGLKVDFTKNRPDFIIHKPQKLYVEAVVANIKQDGIKEEERTLKDILSMVKPVHLHENFNNNLDESITRYSNSIDSKYKKYNGYTDTKGKYKKGYIEDRDFDKNAPYIIALSGYEQINYGNNFYYAMLSLLYGLHYDNLNDKYTKKEYTLKPDTDSKIKLGLFLNDEMKDVSAIIFSSTVTLGKLTSLSISQNKSPLKTNSVLCIRHDTEAPYFKHQIISQDSPEYLSDGLFIFHNPFASNPLSKKIFENTNAINVHFDIDKGRNTFEGNNLPIVSRLNLFLGEHFFKSSISQIVESFNPNISFVFSKVLEIDSDDDESFNVLFINLDNNIEFTINFEKEKFKEYDIQENKNFVITFLLEKDSDVIFKTIEQLEMYWKLSKIKCLSFGEGCIIIDVQQIKSNKTQEEEQV